MVFVLDALSRSGTTLLSSLLHSQENVACYRGVFHEALACRMAIWPSGYAIMPMLSANTPVTFREEEGPEKGVFNPENTTFFSSSLRKQALEVLDKEKQYGVLTPHQWESLLQRPLLSFEDLDQLYEEVRAAHTGVAQLGFRWNQAISYLPLWKARAGPHLDRNGSQPDGQGAFCF